jgi:hypothetical protein
MKQLNLFSKQELKNLGRKINTDLATKQITDEALKKILPKLQLVSSKQLATILSKKNDNSLRAQRCMNIGFTWYKDSSVNLLIYTAVNLENGVELMLPLQLAMKKVAPIQELQNY